MSTTTANLYVTISTARCRSWFSIIGLRAYCQRERGHRGLHRRGSGSWR